MDSICWMFALFGFIGFCSMGSLKRRIRRLERQIRIDENIDEMAETEDLREQLQNMIGEEVEFVFCDDDDSIDLIGLGTVQIIDIDEKWVLVHLEEKKRKQDKLLRISSIRGVTRKAETLVKGD